MAIKKKILSCENEVKETFETAYMKINDVEIRISTGNLRIKILFFASKDARDANGLSILKKEENISLDTLKPFIKEFTVDGIKTAAYEYLKTLPFYKGVDC